MFKVGLTALHSVGPQIVTQVAARKPVFVDAKLHDIPMQVEGAAGALAELGAAFVSVHASGGRAMVEAAVRSSGKTVVLAVTVLTSLDAAALEDMGLCRGIEEMVERLAVLALDAGAGGLVCSSFEVAALRRKLGARTQGGPLIVVPGVRPAGWAADDQARTAEPRRALSDGADVLVVGRPITAAADPGSAAAALIKEIS